MTTLSGLLPILAFEFVEKISSAHNLWICGSKTSKRASRKAQPKTKGLEAADCVLDTSSAEIREVVNRQFAWQITGPNGVFQLCSVQKDYDFRAIEVCQHTRL